MAKYGIEGIDLVCVNTFILSRNDCEPNKTHEDAIENIDIGGPAMIRSAAKKPSICRHCDVTASI